MAWAHYYINTAHLYDPGKGEEDPYVFYELKIPPHGSIREEWTTVGMEHGGAQISFVEYAMEDDDIDGVWEAYGMKRESEYSFTIHADAADPEKLFVYTLSKDGNLATGYDFDPEQVNAILVFPQAQSFTAEQLADAWEQVKNAPRVSGAVEAIVRDVLLGGREDVMGFAYFQR